ncbi:MAG: AAA family ATPase [Microcoleus sp. PH2017_29_MFU_D_A]|uniref:trifunctional serine/threonine-protein kinase/ATP-binding protein/sensor histidine kinase n=1 Tax=unclassified Microcoleus TaxID=2642155 RepID=UPI001D56B529|nr:MULTISPECIES: ATP-binding sensor histidine kinase [unclassified Microcoleus]TAF88121.1 MAG: GAF domain-containing protein [Oscillatoriales cyanobacterium]MCC3448322.1 AAA family ATPase [Microcoleus sp. PH2017_09_SFU_O_A]MCC3472078.1 AAA family ATPase [Microcoleus sp. PH2017_13_LAR_U_A]MCC3484624.1 AAA family ATPase [Microcoleus sp. PH2017_14_LAR_D_A]MCC3496565.1 AAA family ATPase [Microcoleus sp. PH2017_15_JOR_U_A]
MQIFSEYQIHSTLHEGAETIIYHGQRASDESATILKVLKAEYPTLEAITRLKHEYQIRQNLDSKQIVKAISLKTFNHRLGIVLEDFGGESLGQLLEKARLSLLATLNIAIQIVKALEYLHQNQIIHKDIKPSNIIINSQTKQVKLTDFGIATKLNKENPQFNNPNSVEGTLAYMSPEQTGRMNRTLDYRTDFYSLGITLYEMLTGELPFPSKDPLEIVYSHIATQAISAAQINSEIPTSISGIVMKLMSKNAEDRYQSAAGLLADLENCLHQLEATGEIIDFIPGRLDILSQLLIPQKLYGRENQVNELLAAFERVGAGSPESLPPNQNTEKPAPPNAETLSPQSLPPNQNTEKPARSQSELMLVSGYSGIGKSAVVNEVSKPITRSKGYFISGKFDQFKRNIPYASLIQAFNSLLRQLLTESTAAIETWRTKILTALETNGKVISDVIPEVELIIGKQPEVAELSPVESQNRFNRVFKEFIRVFAQKEHPLVIFLDDLQWSDSATLKLMQTLITDPDQQYLLLIGAYRDNEVSPTHPLIQTVEEIEKTGTVVNNIVLQPLELENVTELVFETLSNFTEKANNLAELICNKTGGNPFFLTQLLQALYQENFLKFEFDYLAGKGGWDWSIDEIQAIGITDKSVVELVASRIEKLPAATQEVLKLAACVGDKFALDVLSLVSEESVNVTATELYSALQAGLILPLSDAYRIPLVFDRAESIDLKLDTSRVSYKFLHDRVQQAAYSLIPENQKQSTHLKIGELLLQNTPPEKLEENIFDIVNQLNVGIDTISQPAEKTQLAELNLTAGRKAKSANAYEAAVRYLRVAMGLLPEESWDSQYQLTLAIYESTAGAEYLNTNYSISKELVDVILSRAKTLLDKLNVYELQIQSYTVQNRVSEAVNTGLEVLKLLGIYFPQNPKLLNILVELINTKLRLGLKGIEDLANLPEMTDSKKQATMRILSGILGTAMAVKPRLLPLLVFMMVKLSIKYGNSPYASVAYVFYGAILCGIGDISLGYQFGQLAIRLLDRFPSDSIKSRVYLILTCSIQHRKVDIKLALSYMMEGFKAAIETGDLPYVGYSVNGYCTYKLWMGEPLELVEEEISKYLKLMQKLKQEGSSQCISILRYTAIILRGQSVESCNLVDKKFNEDQIVTAAIETKNFFLVCFICNAKSMINFFFGNYAQASENSRLFEKYEESVSGFYLVSLNNFYYSLSLLALYSQSDKEGQKQYLNKLVQNQNKMKKWAVDAPMNYQHKYDLVAAEKARVLGYDTQAMDLYDRAIAGAAKNGYIQEEALAYELAGEFYQFLGKQIISQAYLTKAYYGYIRWGALAKVKHLESRHPFLVAQTRATETRPIDVTRTNTGSTTSNSLGDFLDVATFIKSSQAINSEIVLDNLLTKLITIILENAAAQKVALLLLKDNKLYIEAVGNSTDTQATVLRSIPFENSQDLPVSAINYVFRTQKPLVLDDATVTAPFNADAYIREFEIKSILCLPVIYQSQLQGIIYLENKLAAAAFTADRVEVLKVLVSQVAIAIENARLYAREQEKSQQLEKSFAELQQAQLQLIQGEKMSSLGNLVAGVAHEINNPVGFISGNITEATAAVGDLISHLRLYQEEVLDPSSKIAQDAEDIDLEYLIEDLPKMLGSMKVGCDRIRNISTSLRTFSRGDTRQKVSADIHEGIDSTLMILQHRLKANPGRPLIQVVKEYGNIPKVKCYLGQLNQVFMNLLANAIDCFDEFNRGRSYASVEAVPNTIAIITHVSPDNNSVVIRIKDNGGGMSPDVRAKIFDHLFTTKGVGKGTGLGLSISRQIVEETHGGKLTCESVLGAGTEFAIEVPID